jgi:hypothetical protein
MTPTTIILIIVILLLVYVLYAYLTATVTKLSSSASLKTVTPPITDVSSPRNTRYGYTVWVYVNTWDNNSAKTIFSRPKNIKLYLDNTSPTLKMDLTMNDTAASTSTMVITNNFPLQKWVCVAISVDNQFADAYLDGKLIKSHRFYSENGAMPAIPSDSTTSPIYLGNSEATTNFGPFDAFISEFKRWTAPIDPQTAWDTYLAGNGTNSVSRAFSSYGIDVSVLKNNVEQTRFSF